MDALSLFVGMSVGLDSLSDKTLATLRLRGICLSGGDARRLFERRDECLSRSDSIEVGSRGLDLLLQELSACGPVGPDAFLESALPAVDLFYAVREGLGASVADEEVVHAIVGALEDVGGCFECLDAHELSASLAEKLGLLDGYAIADDLGGRYRWRDRDGEWFYDECGSGWDGEAWGSDYDR